MRKPFFSMAIMTTYTNLTKFYKNEKIRLRAKLPTESQVTQEKKSSN